MENPPRQGMIFQLESRLPGELPRGSSTALSLMGHCWHAGGEITGLEVRSGDQVTTVRDHGMPRPDLAPAGEPGCRSGFWVTHPVSVPADADSIEIRFEARLAGGERVPLPPVSIPASQPASPVEAEPAGIAVCMATYEPDPVLFKAQIDSIREQTFGDWICLISDDCSSEQGLATIRGVIGSDPRFVVSRSEERLGFYRNFERSLGMVPEGVELIALSDQDDRWYPEKLEVLRSRIGDATLIYSDQRLTDPEGNEIAPTLWIGRRNNHTNLASMIVANTVTGAASMLRRDLLDQLLPFPEVPGWQFHDQWIGIAALANGDVAYADQPLYDYVQHRGAILGQLASEAGGSRGPKVRLKDWIRPWKSVSGYWRAGYFFDVLRVEAQVETVLLRGGSSIDPSKAKVLRRFRGAENSIGTLIWLLLRPARAVFGRNETLGTESDLVRGLLWRRLIGFRLRRSPGKAGIDASLPPGGPAAYGSGRLRRWRAG